MSKTEYNFTRCPERRGYGSLKWERYANPEVLPLWVADMDFETAPEIVAALQARLDHGVLVIPCRIPNRRGSPPLS